MLAKMLQLLSKVNTNVKAPLLLNFGNGILMRKPAGTPQKSSSFLLKKLKFRLWKNSF